MGHRYRQRSQLVRIYLNIGRRQTVLRAPATLLRQALNKRVEERRRILAIVEVLEQVLEIQLMLCGPHNFLL